MFEPCSTNVSLITWKIVDDEDLGPGFMKGHLTSEFVYNWYHSLNSHFFLSLHGNVCSSRFFFLSDFAEV